MKPLTNNKPQNQDKQMSELIPYTEIAKKLGVGVNTIRRTVAKVGNDLGLTVQRKC